MRKLVILLFFFSIQVGAQDTLLVGYKIEPPFVFEHEDNLEGLSIELWKKLAANEQKVFRFIQFPDQLSLLRALDFKEIDVSINPMHINETTVQLLTPSQPYYVSRVGAAVSAATEGQLAIILNNFFSIDFLRAVFALLFVIFIFGALLWFVEKRQNTEQFRNGPMGLFDGLWWSAVTMTTVGYGDKAPQTLPGRVIATVWMFTSIIIISGFTASISSTLTVNILSREIKSIQDLKDGINVGAIEGSASIRFLRQHKIFPSDKFNEPEEALSQLADDEFEALIYDRALLNYHINDMELESDVQLLPGAFLAQYKGFMMSRDNPAADWINYRLVEILNNDDWQEILQKYRLETNN